MYVYALHLRIVLFYVIGLLRVVILMEDNETGYYFAQKPQCIVSRR